jgi:2-iminobutanoate/2-iminopropanoate deaminase
VLSKESIPFGDAMGMKVAFCNGLAVDLDHVKRMIWVSGQLPFDKDGQLVGKGDIGKQTDQCIKNIVDVLSGLGGTLNDVVQVTVFVKDMGGLETIHKVRLRHFREPYPTSTLVEVKGFVHPEALIEINAVAAL